MSLIGIDVGSSSVKVAAYSLDGTLVGEASHAITPIYPAPGQWETDPEDIWESTAHSMRQLMAQATLRHDPPQAIAVSASGRENFPADAHGKPLGNGLMGADVRGAEFETMPTGAPSPEAWCLSCGHPRERMDPIFRLAWWQKYRPQIMAQARYFFGWIDFLNFRMTGRAVMDHSTASRYLVYDLASQDWSHQRISEHAISQNFLPELLPWGAVIGDVLPAVAEDWGLPAGVKVAQGCHDLNCAAYGAGVHEIGTVCLVSGSYENILVPTDQLPSAAMLTHGLSIMPQPCQAGLSVIAVHPTGNAVMNWARATVDESIETMAHALQDIQAHSPVLALPYLSGSMTGWEDGRKARGALIGLTLATSKRDIVQAFMEAVAYDIANSLTLLKSTGIEVKRIRITGGGARSAWWTQLKADLTGMPIEIVHCAEPGTLGAAMLAGCAIGVYEDMEAISTQLSGTTTVVQPNLKRAELHQAQFADFQRLMTVMLEHVY